MVPPIKCDIIEQRNKEYEYFLEKLCLTVTGQADPSLAYTREEIKGMTHKQILTNPHIQEMKNNIPKNVNGSNFDNPDAVDRNTVILEHAISSLTSKNPLTGRYTVYTSIIHDDLGDACYFRFDPKKIQEGITYISGLENKEKL